jgi:hypothetical protein
MRVTDPMAGGEVVDARDPRVRTGVLIAPAGGGERLFEFTSEHFPFARHPSFSELTAPALVVVGGDNNPMFSSKKNWRADAYHQSPGPKSLLTFLGSQHSFGGIAGPVTPKVFPAFLASSSRRTGNGRRR